MATVEFDDDLKILHGHVIGTNDVITFESKNADDLEQAFRDSVDEYLAFCEKVGKRSDKPVSGTLNARLGKERHRKLSMLSTTVGKSINELINEFVDAGLADRHHHGPLAGA